MLCFWKHSCSIIHSGKEKKNKLLNGRWNEWAAVFPAWKRRQNNFKNNIKEHKKEQWRAPLWNLVSESSPHVTHSIWILTVCYFKSNMRRNSVVHFRMTWNILHKQRQTVTCRLLAASSTVSNWWWKPSDAWTWLFLRSLSLQWILAAAAMPGFFLLRELPVTPWTLRRLKRCVSSWTAPWQVQTNSRRPMIKAWKHAGETTNPWFTDW